MAQSKQQQCREHNWVRHMVLGMQGRVKIVSKASTLTPEARTALAEVHQALAALEETTRERIYHDAPR